MSAYGLRGAAMRLRSLPGFAGQVVAVVPPVSAAVDLLRHEVEAGARRIDATAHRVLPAVVGAVVDRLDLTDVISRHIDLDRIVAGVDIDAIIDRLDLIGLTEQVVEGIDLPELIRESTGSMGSEAVRGVRIQGIEADQAVNRLVDRLMLRKGRSAPAHGMGLQPTTR